MPYQITRKYEIVKEQVHTITVTEEEHLEHRGAYSLDETPTDSVDYDPDSIDIDEMFDYFVALGHNVDYDEEALDYECIGTEIEEIA